MVLLLLGACSFPRESVYQGVVSQWTTPAFRRRVTIRYVLSAYSVFYLHGVDRILKNSVSRDVTPCIPLKVNLSFGGIWCFARWLLHVGCLLGLIFNPEDETICFSEMLVVLQWTTQRYIPEDRTFHNHRYENLSSYMEPFCLIWSHLSGQEIIQNFGSRMFITVIITSNHWNPSSLSLSMALQPFGP
jgi:hypothetical protein